MGVAVRKMFTKGHWSGGAAQLHDTDDGQVHSIVPGGAGAGAGGAGGSDSLDVHDTSR